MQITISAVLAILVLSLAPFYNGYSTTDDEEGIDRLLENGAQSGESEDGTEAGGPTVNIDPSSSDSLQW